MKILLVRKANTNADLLDQGGLTGFLKGQPLKVSPVAWNPEFGLSHYGYVLDGMKLDDLHKLAVFVDGCEGASIVNVTNEDIAGALESRGLHVNPLA